MNFELSKDKNIVKRINELRLYRAIFLITELLFVVSIYVWCFSLSETYQQIICLLIQLVLVYIVSSSYHKFALAKNRESILKELNPELFLNINIWEYKLILFKSKSIKDSALINIASAYTYDGNFDEAEKVLDYLEKSNLKKQLKALYLLRKLEWLFFKKKYKEVKEIKDDILCELEQLPNEYKMSILSNVDMYISMIDKDKKKLKLICEGLEKTEVNINKVYSIYIKSLFFEEKDNKYQKMLAFEGGNLFFAREELEDQNITTKNNMKPNKHKLYKNSSIFILIIQIIAIIIGIIRLI